MSGNRPFLPLSLSPLFDTEISTPLIIAGPCSAESREQVLRTAQEVSACEVRFFRAGLWKPRTYPGGFEGVGESGIPWLCEAREQTGMKICTEVATAEHVRKILPHRPDMLWIGARTTSDPFAVEEIAKELRGSDIPILVKNPLAPDRHAWIGALKRLNQHGITRLAAVLRGFSVEYPSVYRNDPLWHIAHEIALTYPELPLLADPSHMAGRANLVIPLAHEAMHRRYQGLMIETHIDPPTALSDCEQQLTPGELSLLLAHIEELDPSPASFAGLDLLRRKIDRVDEEILHLLSDRFGFVKEVAQWKKMCGSAAFHPARYEESLHSRLAYGLSLGLDERDVRELYDLLHEASLRIQTDILNTEDR